jgi:hypothetical protein
MFMVQGQRGRNDESNACKHESLRVSDKCLRDPPAAEAGEKEGGEEEAQKQPYNSGH